MRGRISREEEPRNEAVKWSREMPRKPSYRATKPRKPKYRAKPRRKPQATPMPTKPKEAKPDIARLTLELEGAC